MAIFRRSLANSDSCLFKELTPTEFRKLSVDWRKLSELMDTHGGPKVFGSWPDWGDVFDLRDEQNDWPTSQDAYGDVLQILDVDPLPDIRVARAVLRKVDVVEVVDVAALRELMLSDEETPHKLALLKAYLRRLDIEGVSWTGCHFLDGEKSEFRQVTVAYQSTNQYGRLIAVGPSIQKCSRTARVHGLSRVCASVDAACCHLRLAVRRLEKCTEPEQVAMVSKAASNYKAWRTVLGKYSDGQPGTGKLALVKLSYGARPANDIPFVRAFASQFKDGAMAIVRSDDCKWVAGLHADRANPLFSRLAAILSFDECGGLDAFCDVYRSVTHEHAIPCLMYDGAEPLVTTANDLAALHWSVSKHNAVSFMPLEVRSLPTCLGVDAGLVSKLVQGGCQLILRSGAVPTAIGKCLPRVCEDIWPDIIAHLDIICDHEGMSVGQLNKQLLQPRPSVTDGHFTAVTGAQFDQVVSKEKKVLCHINYEFGACVGHFVGVVELQDGIVELYDPSLFKFLAQGPADVIFNALRGAGDLTLFIYDPGTPLLPPNGPAYNLQGAGKTKWNQQHKCSGCNQVGHRIDTCPKKTKTMIKAHASVLRKQVPYTTTKVQRVLLKNLKQVSYPRIVELSEKEAKAKIISLGELPLVGVKTRTCWKCGSAIARIGRKGIRCVTNKHKCGMVIRRADVAYTPLWHFSKGGHVSHQVYLRAQYIFGLKIPQDATRHLLGVGIRSMRTYYNMLRIATAFAELHTGRSTQFGDGTLEMDGTSSALKRAGSEKFNTHMGRFIVVIHRETGQYALEPLADKDVLKGAPPPPEKLSEVKAITDRKFHAGHIASTDSAQAFKKAFKQRNEIFHVSVIHKKKNWSHVVKIPMHYLSKRVQARVSTLPTTSRRTYKMKTGDQMAENIFSVIKRNVLRMNLKGRSANASLNFLSASWLTTHPGVEGVAKAITIYQDAIRDTCHPKMAFKSTEWLRVLEPTDT